MAKRSNVATMPETEHDGSATGAVADAISSLGAEVCTIKYRIEDLSNAIGASMNHLADAMALSIIAQTGTNDERAIALEKLKTWFEEFRKP